MRSIPTASPGRGARDGAAGSGVRLARLLAARPGSREKQALIDEFRRGGAIAVDVTVAVDRRTCRATRPSAPVARTSRVRQILLDNMPSADGRPGYRVLTPFRRTTGGALLLVDRGWVPLGDSREQLPALDVPDDAREITGRLDRPPVPGLRMREAVVGRCRGLAAGDELPDVGAARGRPRRADRTADRAAGPAGPGRLRAQVAAGVADESRAPPCVRDPVVCIRRCVAVVVLVVASLRRGQRRRTARRHDRGRAPGTARGRRSLLALAALFFVPVAVAFWLYYGTPGWRPRGAANQGELVDPAVPLPALEFAAPTAVESQAISCATAGPCSSSVRPLRRALPRRALPDAPDQARAQQGRRSRAARVSRDRPVLHDRRAPGRAPRSHRGSAYAVRSSTALTRLIPALDAAPLGGRRAHLHRRPARQPDDELCRGRAGQGVARRSQTTAATFTHRLNGPAS